MLFNVLLSVAAVVAAQSKVTATGFEDVVNMAVDKLGDFNILQGKASVHKSWPEVFAKIPAFSDPAVIEGVKNGSITNIHFSQEDVNKMAEASSGGIKVFSDLAIPQTVDDVAKIPLINKPDAQGTLDSQANSGTSKDRLVRRKKAKISHITEHSLTSKRLAKQKARSSYQARDVTNMNSALQLPDTDVFYSPQSVVLTQVDNGQLIAYRRIAFSTGAYNNNATAYQGSFRSQDSRGGPTPEVTTVIVPKTPRENWMITYIQHEDSLNTYCSPSFQFRAGINDGYMTDMLNHDYVVNLPDHQGRLSAFGATLRGAQALLNSIRAAEALGSIFFFDQNQHLLYGYSGGSSLVAMAGEIAHSYAADLVPRLRGFAVGGFVISPEESVIGLNKSPWSAFVVSGLAGLGREYPDVQELLDSQLKSEVSGYYNASEALCAPQAVVTYYGQDALNLFFKSGSAITQEPALRHAFEQQYLGTKAFPFPLYVFQSTADEVANVGLVDSLLDNYCASGASVQYNRENGGAHLDEEQRFYDHVLQFFDRVIANQLPGTCGSHQDALTNL